jgi:hypothetical protein
VPLPDEALEQLRAFRKSELRGRGSDVGEVWEIPHYLVAYLIQAKSRPVLVVAVVGPADLRARVLAVEGTSQPQRIDPVLCLTLAAGEAGVVVETHFPFVPSRVQQFQVDTLVDECAFWGELPADRRSDLEAAIKACRIVVLRRARGLPQR